MTPSAGAPRIRAATAKDVPALRILAEVAYQRYLPRMRKKPAPMLADYAALVAQGCVFCLSWRGHLVGLLVMMPRPENNPDHLFVENVAVDPACQGRGFGRQLMRHASETAKAKGLRRLRLYTNAVMHENLAFYRHLGFVVEDRRREAGYDRIYLIKELS